MEIYVGSMPNFNNNGVMVSENFTGCIKNLFFNTTNFISELKERKQAYKQYGELTFTCLLDQVIPVTFLTSESYLNFSGYNQSIMNCSFDFRTFNEEGLLLYNKFHQKGYVKVFLKKGKIKIDLQGENFNITTEASDKYLSDGLWHQVMLILQKNRIELHVDKKPSVTTRQFDMISGDQYFIGGDVFGNQGFIGCIRYFHIEGYYIRVNSLSKLNHSAEGIIFNACFMTDRCNPNPCENEGVCKQNFEGFKCNCDKTGYLGAVCRMPRNFLSCEAYKLSYPKSRRADINIDIDGSGSLHYFPVTCEFPSDPAPFEPFSWWVSRNNRQMDYWGGLIPGSRMCKCGLYGNCKDPSKGCNCDSDTVDNDQWLVDEGDLIEKEFLPVRQLRFGDAGTNTDDKRGRYSIGPLICEGDYLFDNAITFYYEDATIDLPNFDKGHLRDIYFLFKTTAQNGVFVNSRGPTDFIKVMLIDV